MSFGIGSMSGAMATVLSNPFEVVKTRFQLQGELAAGPKAYRSLGHAFIRIVSDEGILSIQKGLVAGVTFQILFSGIRVGLYDHVLGIVKSDRAPYVSKIFAGAATGCMSAAVSSPFYLVKCRLQAQASGQGVAIGTQHGYTGMANGLSQIYKQDGFLGLYRGVDGFILRTAVGSAFQLSVFDVAKPPCQEHLGNYPGTLAAAGLAGVAAATAMNPFDVVCTRLYNQPRLEDGRGKLYSGPLNCFWKSLQAEGPIFLFKGWTSHFFRLGPHTVYTLFFFDKIKEAFS